MDLEEFYSADERRRRSEELEFGRDWTDGSARCSVSWIAATGEVYVMREPLGLIMADPVGDQWVAPIENEQLGIEVLGTISDKQSIEAVMSGWPDAMPQPNSIGWVKERIAHAPAERDDPPAPPSDDLDAY